VRVGQVIVVGRQVRAHAVEPGDGRLAIDGDDLVTDGKTRQAGEVALDVDASVEHAQEQRKRLAAAGPIGFPGAAGGVDARVCHVAVRDVALERAFDRVQRHRGVETGPQARVQRVVLGS
jgi:hypothetical protein